MPLGVRHGVSVHAQRSFQVRLSEDVLSYSNRRTRLAEPRCMRMTQHVPANRTQSDPDTCGPKNAVGEVLRAYWCVCFGGENKVIRRRVGTAAPMCQQSYAHGFA